MIQTDMFVAEEAATPLPLPVPLRLSPTLLVAAWDQVSALHQGAREAGAAGLVVKSRNASYDAGRHVDIRFHP